MPLDYGQRGTSRASRGWWAAAAFGLASVSALLAVNWTYQRHKERAEGWVSDGPPCAELSGAAYAAKGYAARERVLDYDGVTFTRQFGHMACSDPDGGAGLGTATHPVCQYTSPAAIRVKAGAVEAFFEPGPGAQATVTVDKGRVRCQVGGQFSLLHDATYSTPN